MNAITYYQSLPAFQRVSVMAYEACVQAKGTEAQGEVEAARAAVVALVMGKRANKPVWVEAYTRKNGVKVKAHWRSAPVR